MAPSYSYPRGPQPTPATGRRSTMLARAPIHNPYDKLSRPDFDAFIGDITSQLKRALGQEPPPPPPPTVARTDAGVPSFATRFTIADESVVDDSFAEVVARKAKGKARDPREGPGLGRLGVKDAPIELLSDSEEDEVAAEESGEGQLEEEWDEDGADSLIEDDEVYEEYDDEGEPPDALPEAEHPNNNSADDSRYSRTVYVDELSDNDAEQEYEEGDDEEEEEEKRGSSPPQIFEVADSDEEQPASTLLPQALNAETESEVDGDDYDNGETPFLDRPAIALEEEDELDEGITWDQDTETANVVDAADEDELLSGITWNQGQEAKNTEAVADEGDANDGITWDQDVEDARIASVGKDEQAISEDNVAYEGAQRFIAAPTNLKGAATVNDLMHNEDGESALHSHVLRQSLTTCYGTGSGRQLNHSC
jgi:hypothetical protein